VPKVNSSFGHMDLGEGVGSYLMSAAAKVDDERKRGKKFEVLLDLVR